MEEKQLTDAVERSRLVLRYLGNDLDIHEQVLLQEWVNADQANRRLFDELTEADSRARALAALDAYDVPAAVKRLDRQIHLLERKKTVGLWFRTAGVAAAVAAITLGVWFYYTPRQSRLNVGNPGLVMKNDIAPGKNTATLTLANGQTINLSDAKTGVIIDANSLMYDDGTAITSSLRGGTTKQSQQDRQDEIAASRNASRNDGMARTLAVSTPRGGQYQVVLPDGSKVWLNAASSIKFPSSFEGLKHRAVELMGEAYFEIFNNKNQKFVVTTINQQVEVLGTHFNINSYADEGSIKTTLLEGSIRVNHTVTLSPGQQSVLSSSTDELKIQEVNTENIVDWKDNDFVLDGTDFRTAMRKIARWYNVEVVYDADAPVSPKIGGWISRNNKISSVLELISSTGQVQFKIEGRRIRVTK